MLINVSQLLKSNIGATRDFDVSEIINIAGSDSLVQGNVRLTRTDRGILAQGTLHTEIETSCSRCLEPCLYPLTLSIEEEYFPIIDVSSGMPLPLPDEDDCFTIDEHHTLDLTEVISQYALLGVPMKILCRQDCAGLCSACGKNLNEGQCNCPPQAAETAV